jgi:23S rRNA (pseudouridine1915-N3)-methyltransferase
VKFVVVAEGKLKDQALRGWVDEYKKRIQRHAAVQEIEARNSQDLARKVPGSTCVVALEVDGETFTSVRFAEQIARWLDRGRGSICFVIGGAEGIPEELSRAAEARVSLSAMTLPHRLARVVLFEQLYRAITIQRGEPYARES